MAKIDLLNENLYPMPISFLILIDDSAAASMFIRTGSYLTEEGEKSDGKGQDPGDGCILMV